MTPAGFFLIITGIFCATGVILYAVASSNRRAELRNEREDYRDDTIETLVESMTDMAREQGGRQQATIAELLRALTEPINAPSPAPAPVHEQELAGQAAAAIREFHDGFTGDPVDTPDWTDSIFPDARRDEPRIATVRPGDSVIPGQGNWDQMMNEGRAVVDDQMESGDDQWAGEEYE